MIQSIVSKLLERIRELQSQPSLLRYRYDDNGECVGLIENGEMMPPVSWPVTWLQEALREGVAMRIHCPACAEISESEIYSKDILPGFVTWQCPECGTTFRIEIQFYEIEAEQRENLVVKVGND